MFFFGINSCCILKARDLLIFKSAFVIPAHKNTTRDVSRRGAKGVIASPQIMHAIVESLIKNSHDHVKAIICLRW